jgi:hypothetical protein
MLHGSIGSAMVLCVGLPLHEVTRIARSVRHGTIVLAASDATTAHALLGSVDDPVPADGAEPRLSPSGTPAVAPPTDAEVADAAHHPGPHGEAVQAGRLTIDVPAREVLVGDDLVHLSAREFDLLALLASDQHRVWSFSTLVRTVWGTDYLGDHDQLASTVKRLRKRLGPGSGCEVQSVHGVGYRLRVAEAPAVVG